MKTYKNEQLPGERALYNTHGAVIDSCVFFDGESALKECSDIEVINSTFDWKYPIWYSKNIKMSKTKITENGRAAIWYIEDSEFINMEIGAVKCFRRCNNVLVDNVTFTDSKETIWYSKNVTVKNTVFNGDYAFLNCQNIECDNITLNGNYCFDTCENVVVKNSTLVGRDAFWNCKNVTVIGCDIKGAYIGWNTENLTFIDCDIDSLQGLCYIKKLKMKNCRLHTTNLSFELCEDIEAEIDGRIASLKNPISGTIVCDGVDELILDKDQIDPSKTKIIIR
ncbi:MAG: DUF3737 family protein [Bacilli bacterium]|nr:DUF3737 family protein [Bacilli bacterium]